MIVDSQLILSGAAPTGGTVTGQAITGTGFLLSTNTVDLQNQREIGEGEDVNVRFQVMSAVTGATSVDVQLITADDAALTTNVNIIGASGAIPVAQLTAGARFTFCAAAKVGSIGQRYLGLRYSIAGTATGGGIFADLGCEIQDGLKFYPTRIVV